MPRLPAGTVTFLFTDIEGSTRLLKDLGDRYAGVLAEYRQLLRTAVQERGGKEVDSQGDALFVAFQSARDALTAAVAAQRAIIIRTWPDGASLQVRMGLHTGEALAAETGYVGLDVHRTARICAVGHGGQILLSQTTRELVADDLPAGMSLRDLGEHRLKDLARTQRLYQVVVEDLPADFPLLKSLDALPNNLPRQLTSFVGREREMADIRRLLSTTCLLTLTGASGSGKTRLALQVSADLLEEFPDGVWWVELAALSDPALVPQTVASTLSVREQSGRPMTETLLDHFRPKKILIVLDNCEHLLSTCAQLAGSLLRSCPHLKILATSREGLSITGETLYPIPSLSLPDLQRLPPVEHLTRYESVRLFIERTMAVLPAFTMTSRNAQAVVQVCQRLDGIPLAIELAAARTKVLPVEQIAARLDDRFRFLTGGSRTALPRHQTLRAAMDWGYDLLSEQERGLLRRLSVFAGGWTLEDAEAVCVGEGVEATDVLNLLTHLVDKSLVVAEERDGTGRYRLLETVRQYSRDRLLESREAAEVRRQHRDWYLAMAERAEPELQGPQQRVWLDRLETEHDNLRAALEWSSTEDEGTDAGLRLAGALRRFWLMHGHWSEGRGWLERALARGSAAPSSALLKALHGVTMFVRSQGDHARGAVLSEKGLALAREMGDKDFAVRFLFNSGMAAARRGDYAAAVALCEDGIAVARDFGDEWLLGLALSMLGNVQRNRGDYGRAAALHKEGVALIREVGDKWLTGYSLHGLGAVALHEGDHRRAAAIFKEALFALRELGDRSVTGECLEGLAGVACAEGDYERAARLFGAGEVLRKAVGQDLLTADQAHRDESVAATQASLGDTAFAAAWLEGRAMTLEQAIEYALTEVGI